MTRLPDWPARLTSVISWHDAAPFDWRLSDCISFPADVVQAITGKSVDLPNYRSERGARLALRRLGVPDTHGAMAKFFEEIPPGFATTGDLAAVVSDDGSRSGGVVVGALVYVKAKQGLARLPRCRMIRAFKV